MKAKVVSQRVCESSLDSIHGFSFIIKRLVIRNRRKNLAIYIHNNEIHVWNDFNMKNCKVIGEIEISNELVEVALSFIQAKEKLNNSYDLFKAILDNFQIDDANETEFLKNQVSSLLDEVKSFDK